MDSMDLDMDMDVDVDFVADEPILAEADVQDTSADRDDGEVDDDANTPALTKVHIRGLDTLNPDQVKAYVAEHARDSTLERIEWIDDSSANLVFSDEAAASGALSSLIAPDAQQSTDTTALVLLPARSFPAKPDVLLRVRRAVASDKKQAGAAMRSRFYLLNPEYDPEERRRRSEQRRYRDRDGDGPHRRRYQRRREDEPIDHFDVSLYDDDDTTLARRASDSRVRRRRSYASDSDDNVPRRDSRRDENRGKELFPEGSTRRRRSSRDRSASPMRNRDGDLRIDRPLSDRISAPRSRNEDSARAIKSRMSRSNRSLELFPEKGSAGSGRLGDGTEDPATLLAKGITLPLMDGSSDHQPAPARRLEDRITDPARGKLADRITSPGAAAGKTFNIRGSATQRSSEQQGFAIKGVAGKSVRELFPEKFGSNADKELFAEGRSRRRQRAGDLFD